MLAAAVPGFVVQVDSSCFLLFPFASSKLSVLLLRASSVASSQSKIKNTSIRSFLSCETSILLSVAHVYPLNNLMA